MDNLKVTASDLIGLPSELLEQIPIKKSDKTNADVLQAIKDLGGVAHVDKIMIQLWRNTGIIFDKTALLARLYRMHKKGLLIAVSGKKGIFEVQR